MQKKIAAEQSELINLLVEMLSGFKDSEINYFCNYSVSFEALWQDSETAFQIIEIGKEFLKETNKAGVPINTKCLFNCLRTLENKQIRIEFIEWLIKQQHEI